MTSMARAERAELCDVALQVGEDQPTLCGDWTVKDLVIHLLLREGSPASVGAVVPLLSGLTGRASRRLATKDFTVLVERLRNGPPRYSPFALPKVDALANTLELYVHHEDIRRAQPAWEPRSLSPRQENLLWKQVAVTGKALTRGSEVGVVLERSDTGDRAVVRKRDPSVVVRGLPGEVTLFLFGRKPQSRVELLGTDEAVSTLQETSLGF